MKRQIEIKQRDLEGMQNKMALPVDTDILRMKLSKDMEARHRLEVETKQQECDRLAD
jgi:DNA helicase IV